MTKEISVLIVVDPLDHLFKDRNAYKSVSSLLRQKISSLAEEIKKECDLEADIEVEDPSDMGLFWEMTAENPEDV